MWPLRVLLLWALLCPGKGNGDQEEIFTRPGSDLLIPIRIHLTLSHTDTSMCDRYEWKYKNPTRTNENRIFIHKGCTLRKSEDISFPNMRISENGSLIISNVTPENEGRYSVETYNSARHPIQRDVYILHVEVPVSVPVLNVSCLRNGSTEISCRVEVGTKTNISLSVIGGSQELYSASANNITAIVGSPRPWNITCSVKNGVSRLEESSTGITCPVPLSDIAVNFSCLQDGSAVAVCSVKGSDPRYSWSLDGRSVFSHNRVSLPPLLSGTLRCDVTNQINNLSGSINIFCPVPLSDIAVNFSCLQDGSAVAVCSVKGSDPRYSWSLDGRSAFSHNRVSLPPPLSGTLRCDVTNQINNLSGSINIFCPVPVSDPILDVKCLQHNSTEISCEVRNGTDPSIYLIVSGQLMVYNVTRSERTVRLTVPHESPSDTWKIKCLAKNSISERFTNQTHDTCPESRSGMWSGWGHLLSHGVVCVLYTALLIYIVTDLRKMKNEKNRSKKSTGRRDQTEMEMEPTYSN